eukprot:GHVS01098576.1.p1 GENE.GHVS01098576.1~~GHVS01098576.1.p1  ORF type:complete len:989 (+),score=145.96 GHVS01098576.1:163-3129(+)
MGDPQNFSDLTLNCLAEGNNRDVPVCFLSFGNLSMSLFCCGSPPDTTSSKLETEEGLYLPTVRSVTSTATTPSSIAGGSDSGFPETKRQPVAIDGEDGGVLVHPQEATPYDGVFGNNAALEETSSEEEIVRPEDKPPCLFDGPLDAAGVVPAFELTQYRLFQEECEETKNDNKAEVELPEIVENDESHQAKNEEESTQTDQAKNKEQSTQPDQAKSEEQSAQLYQAKSEEQSAQLYQAKREEQSAQLDQTKDEEQLTETAAVCGVVMVDEEMKPKVNRFNTIVLNDDFCQANNINLNNESGQENNVNLENNEKASETSDDAAAASLYECERCGVSFTCCRSAAAAAEDEQGTSTTTTTTTTTNELEDDTTPTSPHHHCWNFLPSLSKTITECYRLLSIDDIAGCQRPVLWYLSECEQECRGDGRVAREHTTPFAPPRASAEERRLSLDYSRRETRPDGVAADVDIDVLYARSLLSLYMDDVFQNVVLQLKGIRTVYRTLADESGWEEIKSRNPEVRCYMREEEPSDLYGKTSYSTRYRGITNIDLLSLLNVTSDLNTAREWDQMVESVDTLFRLSAFHFIAHMVHNFKVPFLARREWLLEYGLDVNRDTGVLTYVMSSVGPSHPFFKYISGGSHHVEEDGVAFDAPGKLGLYDGITFNPNPKNVAADMICAGGAFEVIRPGVVYFDHFVNADIKLPLPGWLLKYVTQEVGGRAIDAALEIARNKTNPEDRMGILMQRKTPFFKVVKQLISEHIEDVRVEPRYARFRDCQQSMRGGTKAGPQRRRSSRAQDIEEPYTIFDWSKDLSSRNNFPLLQKLGACYYYGRMHKLKHLAGHRFAVSVPKRIISQVDDDSDVTDGSTGLPDPIVMMKVETNSTNLAEGPPENMGRRIRVELSYKMVNKSSSLVDPPSLPRESSLHRLASVVRLRTTKSSVIHRTNFHRRRSSVASQQSITETVMTKVVMTEAVITEAVITEAVITEAVITEVDDVV